MAIEFTVVDDDGVETVHSLPSKMEVCDKCEGHGKCLHEAIGSHAYSMEEFNESFDAEEQGEYFNRGGRYDVVCPECDGKRVVEVVDEEKAEKNDPALLKAYYEKCQDDYAYERMCESERRYGA